LLTACHKSTYSFNKPIDNKNVETLEREGVMASGEMLRGKVGPWATGADEFFDREKELTQLIEKITR